MRYRVELMKAEEGGYAVSCPDLPGCWSQGESEEEALTNIQEAISLYLEVQAEMESRRDIRYVEVAV